MTFGNSIPGVGSFIATDLRRGIVVRRATGEVLSAGYDGGGKLVETPEGFATGTGGQDALDVALGALQRGGSSLETSLRAAGYQPAHSLPNEQQRLLRSGDRVITSYADDPAADPDRIALMTISCESPDTVTLSNGLHTNTYRGGVHVTLPSDHSREDVDVLIQRVLREFHTVYPLEARIRIAAEHFSEVSLRSRLASREIELGCIRQTANGPERVFLRGNSTEIAATDPSQIFERFAAFHTASFNPQGSSLPTTLAAVPFSYNSGGPATNRMWVSFSWSAITLYRPDGSTVTIPASASYATPPSPTLSTVVSGALGARTVYVRIGYRKNGVMYHVGPEASIACPANSVVKVTSPPAVTGYDRWVPLVGTSSNGEYLQAAPTFGSDYTESVTGFNATTTSPYDNTNMPNAITAYELPATTLLYFYPYYDFVLQFVALADGGVTAKSDTNAAAQNSDGRYPLSFGGMSLTTPAGAATGSGLVTNGGGRLL